MQTAGKESLLVTTGDTWDQQRATASHGFKSPTIQLTAKTTAALVNGPVFDAIDWAIAAASESGKALAEVEVRRRLFVPDSGCPLQILL